MIKTLKPFPGDELRPRHAGGVLHGGLRPALGLTLLPRWVQTGGQHQVPGGRGPGGRHAQRPDHRGRRLQVQLQLGGARPGRGDQPQTLPARQHLLLLAVPGTSYIIKKNLCCVMCDYKNKSRK